MKIVFSQIFAIVLLIGCSQTSIVTIDNIKSANVLTKASGKNLQTSNSADNEKADQLETLVEIALKNNPGIQAAEMKYDAAKQMIQGIRMNPDPNIGVTYALLPIESRNGAIIGGLKVTQKFLAPGKLNAKSNVQFQESQVKFHNLQTLRIQIEFVVIQTFYQIYLIDRRIEIADLHQKVLQQQEKVIQVMISAGIASQADVLKLQNEISKILTDKEILKDARKTTVAKLNVFLGRNLDTKIEIAKKQELYMKLPEITKIFENALSRNPRIKIFQEEITKAMMKIELAETAYKPDYTVAMQYQMINESDSISSSKGMDNLMLSFSLNLPVFREWRNATSNSAKFAAVSQKYEKTQAENLLILEIKEEYLRKISAQKRMTLLNEVLIPRATQILKVIESAYSTGKADFTNLSIATINLFTYRLQQEEAFTEYLKSVAALNYLQDISIVRSIIDKENYNEQ